jgi:hypothetical protein
MRRIMSTMLILMDGVDSRSKVEEDRRQRQVDKCDAVEVVCSLLRRRHTNRSEIRFTSGDLRVCVCVYVRV